jgi:glycosyltransferase involved in cell wall biosynthesis
MTGPLVSIIVPSYNQGRFIADTLRSILAQDYRPLEILVLDGASSDETVDVLRSFAGAPELRWWSEADAGVVDAVNKGFARARGTIGAIQSSDDAYLPGAVAAAVAAFEEESELALVYGDITKIDAEGREIGRTNLRPYTLEALLAVDTWIPQPAAFFSLALARDLGGWRAEVPYAADTDLWLRIALRARVRKVDRVLGQHRVHPDQRDRRGENVIRDYRRMLSLLPELQARPDLKRAAEAGLALIVGRYSYGAGHLTKVLRNWRSVWLRPQRAAAIGATGLVPFVGPLRALLSRAARRLRPRARPA